MLTLPAGLHVLTPFVERVAYRHSLKEQALDDRCFVRVAAGQRYRRGHARAPGVREDNYTRLVVEVDVRTAHPADYNLLFLGD